MLEQKHGLIDMMVTVIAIVIIALYLTFVVVLWCLFASKEAFSQSVPITAVVLVGMTGSIPTILSISLLVGLLSHKEGKDKDEKSPGLDMGSAVKIASEMAKHAKTH